MILGGIIAICAVLGSVFCLRGAILNDPSGGRYRYIFIGLGLGIYAIALTVFLYSRLFADLSVRADQPARQEYAFGTDYFINAQPLGGKLFVVEEKGTGLAFMGQMKDGYLVGCTQLFNEDGSVRTMEQEMEILEQNREESETKGNESTTHD